MLQFVAQSGCHVSSNFTYNINLQVFSCVSGRRIFCGGSNQCILCSAGTFLVVYICISIVFGIPLVFLEIGLGQFCQEGTTKLWRAVPLFKGKVRIQLRYPFIPKEARSFIYSKDVSLIFN
jgi:hypothetical protein